MARLYLRDTNSLSHLVRQPQGVVGSTSPKWVRPTFIAADLPKGASDQAVRTVTENSRTLKFDTHGIERE